jgi:hypothetical protein
VMLTFCILLCSVTFLLNVFKLKYFILDFLTVLEEAHFLSCLIVDKTKKNMLQNVPFSPLKSHSPPV